jgi:hypothetical protein
MFPSPKNPPIEEYNDYAGTLVATLAVSPEQAANNAIYSTLHPPLGEKFKLVTKYLHGVCNLPDFVLDIDELDTPVQQIGLFGGKTASHKRRDENRIAEKISRRFGVSNEGENSLSRKISREFITYRRKHPLNQ